MRISEKLYHLLIVSLLIGQSLYAQSWEQIPSKIGKTTGPKESYFSKPYTDVNYNYGSEANPSPRIKAVSWADPNGGLWVFGGVGTSESYEWGLFNDMWKYNPSTNDWKLVNGTSNQAQFVTRQKLKDLPLPRKDAAAWTDNKGNLWLYGGSSLADMAHLDDMWLFDTGLTNWSKVIGTEKTNQKPSHGIKNQAGSGASPGSRSGSATWTDREGNLWLFGGVSYENGANGKADYYNDLWKFETLSRQWSWINGSEKANQISSFGIENEENRQVTPSPRNSAACWFDEKSNQLFLYGGYGYDTTATKPGGLSDMWSYSLKSGTWTPRSEPSEIDSQPQAFTPDSPENKPGFRISAIHWNGEPGELYLSGGHNLWGADQIYMERRL